jgi:hypothetical protein
MTDAKSTSDTYIKMGEGGRRPVASARSTSGDKDDSGMKEGVRRWDERRVRLCLIDVQALMRSIFVVT